MEARPSTRSPHHDEHPRRTGPALLPVLAIAAITAFALAACAPAAEVDEEQAAADAALLPAAEGATAYPLTLATPYGETVLTERPQRIAVVGGDGDMDAVLALGVAPVIGVDDTDAPWYEGTRAEEMPGFFDPWSDTVALEKIIASQPDLIVASTLTGIADHYADLARIAPVLALDPASGDWHELTAAVGAALDLPGAATTVVDDADARIAAVAAANPQFVGKTVAIVVNYGTAEGLRLVNMQGTATESLLTSLGFAPHPQAAGDFGANEEERFGAASLPLVEADVVVIGLNGGDGTPADATAWLESTPEYQALGATTRGAISVVEPNADTGTLDLAWALATPSALATPWAAEQIATAVGAALPPA